MEQNPLANKGAVKITIFPLSEFDSDSFLVEWYYPLANLIANNCCSCSVALPLSLSVFVFISLPLYLPPQSHRVNYLYHQDNDLFSFHLCSSFWYLSQILPPLFHTSKFSIEWLLRTSLPPPTPTPLKMCNRLLYCEQKKLERSSSMCFHVLPHAYASCLLMPFDQCQLDNSIYLGQRSYMASDIMDIQRNHSKMLNKKLTNQLVRLKPKQSKPQRSSHRNLKNLKSFWTSQKHQNQNQCLEYPITYIFNWKSYPNLVYTTI